MKKLKMFFLGPYGPMAVVLAMYVLKVFAKGRVGADIHSPMIVGDAWHNVGDIVEASVAILILRLSRAAPSQDYPFGRKNLESLAKVAVGAFLCIMAGKLLIESAFGLASWLPGVGAEIAAYNPFPREALKMGPEIFWIVVGVTGGSVLLSILVSRYQIAIGRATGSGIVTADGQETASDGYVEAAILSGILGEYLFGEARIEYLFALVVVRKLTQTGRELFGEGLDVLLQRSLGPEREAEIRETIASMPGVTGVAKLKTFRAGAHAVVITKISTRLGAEAQNLMRKALAPLIGERLREADLGEAKCYLRFEPPDPASTRVAYAIRPDGRIAASLADADRLRICDIEDGEPVRCKDEDKPSAPGAAMAHLARKRVRALYATGTAPVEAYATAACGISCLTAPSDDPDLYDLG